MPWLELQTPTNRHRKIRALAASLDIPVEHALGCITKLWCDILEQQEDGNLESWGAFAIADSFGFLIANPDRLVEILRECNLMDDWLIHDWIDYAGRYLKGKYRTNNPERLREIWAIHGKSYDEQEKALDKKKKKKKIPFQKDSDVWRLSDLLRRLMLENDPKAKVPADESSAWEKWLVDADRLIRVDKRPLQEAIEVLRWSQNSEFWRANILSIPKFRKKYQTLLLQSKNKQFGAKSNVGQASPVKGKYEGITK